MRLSGYAVLAIALATAGCGTWSTASVEPATGAPAPTSASAKSPAQVTVTENDVTDRPYTSLGDISVTVRKATIFDKDPTREKVNEELQEQAAKLGADAVVLARYGTVGIGFMSWGQMDGQGRAIQFKK
jgi:hypothetical protein